MTQSRPFAVALIGASLFFSASLYLRAPRFCAGWKRANLRVA